MGRFRIFGLILLGVSGWIPSLNAQEAASAPPSNVGSEMTGVLKWEKRVQEINATPSDKEVTAVFSFVNDSDKPVEVLGARTSCGCTTVNAVRKTYLPQESGTIEVHFTFGSRKGRQEKTIVVETAEESRKRYALTLRVNIPDVVKIKPEKLSWKLGEPMGSQSFEVTPFDPGTTKLSGIKVMGTAFTAVLEEVEPEKRYRVTVTPLTTEKAVRGAIRLEVIDDGKARAIYLPVVVE